MPKLMEMKRSQDTSEKYKQRTISLLKKAKKEFDIPSYQSVELKQFVGWLISNKNNMAYNTWKQYRAAVTGYFEDIKTSDLGITDGEKTEILDLLSNSSQDYLIKKTKKTSNKKMKKFPIKDFMAILDVLEGLNEKVYVSSNFVNYLKFWLNAGIITGLRPVEWGTSEYIDVKGKEKLIVKNAKNSNGRAHGETRTIHLNNLTEDEKKIIKQHVENANYFQNIGKFSFFYKSCADLLRRIGNRLWPKREEIPCLYSLRHQFAADAKASGLTREEIAALMGHATDDTATVHYAKERSGRNAKDFCRVKADPEEVLKIRMVYEKVNKPELRLDLNFKLTNLVK